MHYILQGRDSHEGKRRFVPLPRGYIAAVLVLQSWIGLCQKAFGNYKWEGHCGCTIYSLTLHMPPCPGPKCKMCLGHWLSVQVPQRRGKTWGKIDSSKHVFISLKCLVVSSCIDFKKSWLFFRFLRDFQLQPYIQRKSPIQMKLEPIEFSERNVNTCLNIPGKSMVFQSASLQLAHALYLSIIIPSTDYYLSMKS